MVDIREYRKLHMFKPVDERTQEHFSAWGDVKKNPALADEVQLQPKEDDADFIRDNTKVPWVNIKSKVFFPAPSIKAEAQQLLRTECFTSHRADNSGGWMSLCVYGMSSVHTNSTHDYQLPEFAERDLSDWTDISKFWKLDCEDGGGGGLSAAIQISRPIRNRHVALYPSSILFNI